MYKFFRKTRLIKCICFLLIVAFTINISGCGDIDNEVPEGHVEKDYLVGKGGQIQGYTVYSESTFDQMTYELYHIQVHLFDYYFHLISCQFLTIGQPPHIVQPLHV